MALAPEGKAAAARREIRELSRFRRLLTRYPGDPGACRGAVRGPVFAAIGHGARLRAFGNGIPRKSQGMRYVVYVPGPVRFAVRSRAAALPVALLYSPIKKPAYSGLS